MRPKLSVSLLGRFALRAGEQPLLEHAPRKVKELLAYLVLHADRPYLREHLASLLWGDVRTETSLKNLRQALWQLRLGLNGAGGASARLLLRSEPRWLQFVGADRASVDVFEFERTVAEALGPRRESPSPALLTRLKAAADLYRGDLLEGWYGDWCAAEREHLLRLYLCVLDELAECCAASGEYEAGIRYTRRALARDSARESSHRAVMRLLHRSGDRSGALRAYERCVAALRSDLQAEPDEQTVELAREIRGGGAARPPGPTPGRDASRREALE
jgi:DNA-binding SARP family transcriptional activator